jgi:hypothetical protein
MNQDPKFTEALQAWMNTPDAQKNWDEGAILLLQLSGNRIMYRNISVNPKGKAEFIKGQLQKYLNFRLQKLTHDQVADMQTKVDDIVKNVIKPAVKSETEDANKSEEFADFKAGKRPDHDDLPEEIQALYVENLDIVHRMRELHLKLRTLSLDNATCPDSERYPFLKEIINLDKKRVANWDIYDHFIPGTPVAGSVNSNNDSEKDSDNPSGESDNPNVNSVNPKESTEDSKAEAPAEKPTLAETKPKKSKVAAKRTAKKATGKKTV